MDGGIGGGPFGEGLGGDDAGDEPLEGDEEDTRGTHKDCPERRQMALDNRSTAQEC